MHRSASLCRGLLLVITTLAFSLGCSASKPQPGSVKGRVTLGGTPLSTGIVTFVSSEGFGGSSPVRDNGTFELPLPLPPGNYQVCVSPPAGQQTQSTIPVIYHLPTTTPVVQTLSSGPNDVVVALSASPEVAASVTTGASNQVAPQPSAAQ